MYPFQSALSRDQLGRIRSQKKKGSRVVLLNQNLWWSRGGSVAREGRRLSLEEEHVEEASALG